MSETLTTEDEELSAFSLEHAQRAGTPAEQPASRQRYPRGLEFSREDTEGHGGERYLIRACLIPFGFAQGRSVPQLVRIS